MTYNVFSGTLNPTHAPQILTDFRFLFTLRRTSKLHCVATLCCEISGKFLTHSGNYTSLFTKQVAKNNETNKYSNCVFLRHPVY